MQLKKLLQDQKELAKKLRGREKKLEFANKKLNIDTEKLKIAEKKIQQEERRIENFANQLFRKEELFTKQLSLSSQKEEKLQEELEKLRKIKRQITDDLGKIVPISSEEAEKKLLSLLKEEVDRDLNKYKEEKIKQSQEKIEEESTKIICSALEKYSSELVFPKTTNILHLENRQIISKVIGKEGRNINAFRRITGTEVVIDRESDDLTIQISSFNSFRREIALQTLQSLIKEERFSPAQIENTFERKYLGKNVERPEWYSGSTFLSIYLRSTLVSVHPQLSRFDFHHRCKVDGCQEIGEDQRYTRTSEVVHPS